jgi:hypothetical protein
MSLDLLQAVMLGCMWFNWYRWIINKSTTTCRSSEGVSQIAEFQNSDFVLLRHGLVGRLWRWAMAIDVSCVGAEIFAPRI